MLSFLLFGLVGERLSEGDARDVYFFSFALGFCVVALRTFCTLSAHLHSQPSRSAKLKQVRAVARTLPLASAAVGLVAVLVLRNYGLSWPLVLTTTTIITLSGFDGDLVRAVVRGTARFPSIFGSGSVLALLYLWLFGPTDREGGCIAFVLQWVPVVVSNVFAYLRMVNAGPIRSVKSARERGRVSANMLLALFDGGVLNAPFLVHLDLPVGEALDLSIATRFYASSLPLLPLLVHWSNSGRLRRVSERLRIAEHALFGWLTGLAAGLAGLLFAFLFSVVSSHVVNRNQIFMFAALVVSYSIYCALVRYGMHRISSRVRILATATVASAFYVVLLASDLSSTGGAPYVVGAQSVALIAIATIAYGGLVRKAAALQGHA
ncbi:MAG: hypothetical protein OEZ06_01220 [Myxococcales bacterium]|nr:hypothetical protein [Myxococcales bacterium]